MNDSQSKIWGPSGKLLPIEFTESPVRDIAIVIVNRDRRDLTDYLCKQILAFSNENSLSYDLFVVDIGSAPEGRSGFTTIEYKDDDFRGKCYAHNVGVRQATLTANYRYYWVMMNDLKFDGQSDAMTRMVQIMDNYPEIGLLSPTNIGVGGKDYPGAGPESGHEFRKVAVCDYLSYLIRGELIREVGFLNPDFRYCWGAIHEFSHKIYQTGKWVLAYCDTVQYEHLGGTTYGKTKNVVSRDNYVECARKFAAHYFIEHYGRNWDKDFIEVLPTDVTLRGVYTRHRKYWEEIFPSKERSTMQYVPAGKSLESKINALNPWYYPLTINGIKVVPGIGAKESSEGLADRVKYMGKIWMDMVKLRYDFYGKSLLDIACNCGYWSSKYVELGATHFTGVEGRLDTVRQGQLYWEQNRILPQGNWELIHGNVCGLEIWDSIRKRGPFDFTLCCGILYHIPDYENLLEFLSSVTKEAMLIDTRVEDEETFVQEPGGYKFDGIAETSYKRVPRLDRLLSLLESLGFSVERLRTHEQVPNSLTCKDDYSKNRRVTLLAMKSSMRDID